MFRVNFASFFYFFKKVYIIFRLYARCFGFGSKFCVLEAESIAKVEVIYFEQNRIRFIKQILLEKLKNILKGKDFFFKRTFFCKRTEKSTLKITLRKKNTSYSFRNDESFTYLHINSYNIKFLYSSFEFESEIRVLEAESMVKVEENYNE